MLLYHEEILKLETIYAPVLEAINSLVRLLVVILSYSDYFLFIKNILKKGGDY